MSVALISNQTNYHFISLFVSFLSTPLPHDNYFYLVYYIDFVGLIKISRFVQHCFAFLSCVYLLSFSASVALSIFCYPPFFFEEYQIQTNYVVNLSNSLLEWTSCNSIRALHDWWLQYSFVCVRVCIFVLSMLIIICCCIKTSAFTTQAATKCTMPCSQSFVELARFYFVVFFFTQLTHICSMYDGSNYSYNTFYWIN